MLERLDGVVPARRSARFYCVLVVLRHPDDPQPLVAEGHWDGRILPAPAGAGGFGYDPVFQPAGLSVSAAQLSPGEKNRISHRARALDALLQRLRAQPL